MKDLLLVLSVLVAMGYGLWLMKRLYGFLETAILSEDENCASQEKNSDNAL